MGIARKAVVSASSLPAPIGGLNARDAIAAMKPTDALILDNVFPETSDVRVRNGYTKWATGLPSTVDTLMTYATGAGRKLFAISNGSIYDVTTSGAVGSPVVTGLTNSRWKYVNVGTAGGQFLYAVNGVDKPLLYNGSTWTAIDAASSPAITGVTSTLFSNVGLYASRVWFVERSSFRVWYLPVSSIAGAASSIDLSPLFKLGGYLVSMVTWTIDNASGVQEYACFVSSEGEIVMYVGTDPSSASAWQKQGTFRIGRPVDNRSFCRVGSDVIIVCADGFFPLSKALLTDRTQTSDAVSNKIGQLANSDVATYAANTGWQIHLYPIGNKLIINVPASSSTYQYVMNTITGAWCRFTGWNAYCFENFGDQLMFGGSGYVAWADHGNIDDTSAITFDIKPAFSYFGSRAQKRFTMVRPLMQVDGTLNLLIDLNTDFQDKPPQSAPALSQGGAAQWNTAPWNTSSWQSGTALRANWQSVNGIGYAATLRMRGTTKNQTVILQSTDFVYERGGIL
jgi:hypothetical protein